jgi:hypothetical protein
LAVVGLGVGGAGFGAGFAATAVGVGFPDGEGLGVVATVAGAELAAERLGPAELCSSTGGGAEDETAALADPADVADR